MTEVKQARPVCPDGGTCHHSCASGSLPDCFRVSCCAPLSGVYINDRWPEFTAQQVAPALEGAEEVSS